MTNKTKCLFVSHVPLDSIWGGGAGNSLMMFLQNQDFLDVDLILPFFIGRIFSLPKIIKEAFAQRPPSVRKIYFFPLPWSSCFEGRQTSFKANFAYLINNLIAYLFLPITNKIINKIEYKFIHFNSIVLHQLISLNANHILHMREIIDDNYAKRESVLKNLRNAAGLVFIDQATLKKFNKLNTKENKPCFQIITNPFEMGQARQLRREKKRIIQELGLNEYTGKIFAYIGNIHPVKGVDFIIKAFINAKINDAKLLIVGTGNNKYLDLCLTMVNDDSVNFLGSVNYPDMQKIYAVTDYVLRGDPDFRIGRTVYEALFAGGSVIIPGNKNDLRNTLELQDFSKKIICYEPQNLKSLISAMKLANDFKIENISKTFPTGNLTKHCLEMKEFINRCIKV